MAPEERPSPDRATRRGLRWGLGLPLAAALSVGGWMWLHAPTSEVARIEQMVDSGEGEAAVLAIAALQREGRSSAQVHYLEGYLAFTRGHPATAARLYRRALVAAGGDHPQRRVILRQLLAMAEGTDCQAAAEAAWGLGLLEDDAATGMLQRLADPVGSESPCSLTEVARAALEGEAPVRRAPAPVAPTIPEPALRAPRDADAHPPHDGEAAHRHPAD